MATNPNVQTTDFTRDVIGRYVCNGLDEAMASTISGASPFHYIILGGGTFGGALASFLSGLDPTSSVCKDTNSQDCPDRYQRYHSRVLVLEAGPMLLTEHEQNLPGIGVGVPGAATIAQLQPDPTKRNVPAPPRNEVWGVPWHSDDGFNGLAYCIGGRSVFWGGWAPRFLRSEMPVDGLSPAKWPKRVVDDLHANGEELWNEASHQIGVDDPNDFLNGELHTTLRQIFFEAIPSKIRNMIPLSELPDYLGGDKLATLPPGSVPPNPESLRLDAPYAVQSTTRSGFFPFNKFSSVPLLIGAARQAAMDSQKSDDQTLNNSRRQVMVVPNCHIKRLNTLPVGENGQLRRVVSIETSQGTIEVAHNAVVVFALAAIESARLALDSFPGITSYDQIGKNLMVHLRTNTQFRIKRDNPIFQDFQWKQLEVSGIQLRGRINHSEDGTQGHFHLQIAVSGVPTGQGNPDIELFRKIPDLDDFNFFRSTPDDEVAFAIRGIGEFSPKNPKSRVDLDPELDEFGIRRAFVRINDDADVNKPAIRNLNPKDSEVLAAMADATNDVLKLFLDGLPDNDGNPVQFKPRELRSEPGDINEFEFIKLDGVGTTYHESGTLRMGDDPNDSVVNPDLRFHGVTNAYVTDMSILPTCGSANPVQPGIALTRRLAKHLAAPVIDTVPSEGMFLFKDTPTPFWRLAGAPGDCVNFGFGELEVRSARGDFGLYWCTIPTPPNFELTLDWLSTDPTDNSGIFIRFPDPDKAPPDKDLVFAKPGFVANEYGFEIQIDATRGGSSPTDSNNNVTENVDSRFRGTGAIYNESRQDLKDISGIGINQWHTYIIRAVGMDIEVDIKVNGGVQQPLTKFKYDPSVYQRDDLRRNDYRGLPTRPGNEKGAKRYVGIQTHDQSKLIKFRNIFIKPI